MNAADIAKYAYDAGVRTQSDLQAAVAIALAESGGDPKSYNGRGRDQSYGLWQINMKPSEVGDRKAYLGITNNDQLFDPATNARAMFKISGGGKNWKPWTTWPLRATGYMTVAIGAAAGTIAKKGVTGAADEAVESATDAAASATGLDSIAASTEATTRWVSNRGNWMRVAKVTLGGALVVGGTVLLVKPLLPPIPKMPKGFTR